MMTLPPLPYTYTALEPYLDAKTVEIHYTKHHQAYVDNLNKALAKHPQLEKKSVTQLLSQLDAVPEDIRTAVRNNGGGHANHTLFWNCMKPNGGGKPMGALATAIEKTFGSFDAFKQQFSEKAKTHFASGWVFLAVDNKNNLVITALPGHDSPLLSGGKPLLCIDVWEHAYYLKFQNRRAEFIDAWWNVVNWEYVAQLYQQSV